MPWSSFFECGVLCQLFKDYLKSGFIYIYVYIYININWFHKKITLASLLPKDTWNTVITVITEYELVLFVVCYSLGMEYVERQQEKWI